MGIVRKKIEWNSSVLPIQAVDYHIVEVKLIGEVISIKTIYTAGTSGEAELIQKAIKELDPVAKYYVKAVERK